MLKFLKDKLSRVCVCCNDGIGLLLVGEKPNGYYIAECYICQTRYEIGFSIRKEGEDLIKPKVKEV